MRGQRQQARLLFGQGLAHEPIPCPARERPGVGDLGNPAGELRIEIVEPHL